MSTIRPCLEFCFSPNTVSKFIRIFPKAAVFFLFLHVTIIVYSYMDFSKKDTSPVQGTNYNVKDPIHRQEVMRIEFSPLRNVSSNRNETKKDYHNGSLGQKGKKYDPQNFDSLARRKIPSR